MKKRIAGFSLIEMLVVMGVFTLIAIVATQSLVTSLSGSKKSESTISVRENLSAAVGLIERQLYNADKLDSCPATSTQIAYTDSRGNSGVFACFDIDGPENNVGYIASGSGNVRMTESTVDITSCVFYCTPGVTEDVPDVVRISITGQKVGIIDSQGASVSIDTTVSLRSY